MTKLMTDVLGYKTFVAAGGDLATGIIQRMALNHPQVIRGVHLTDVGYPTGGEDLSALSPAEQQFAEKAQRWWYMEGGYNIVQSTKPQTLSFGLNDSPAGLAAWMVEKFYSWSGCKDDLEKHFSKDELLTNIMIYWVTQTADSSVRTYLENIRAMYAQGMPKPLGRSTVPAAVAAFPNESIAVPREWADRFLNVRRFTDFPRGGHFGALEEPELFANDLLAFLSNLSP